ncbi:hypothetical protein BROUX41_006177 [Berkeleyomyces rouxiae]|uniref:uncharacterized protein n=1 Tax=Berkeleyomyces rouxiae TaxID=2035830 RepID=UPI003B77BF74
MDFSKAHQACSEPRPLPSPLPSPSSSSDNSWQTVSAFKFLEQDPRPAFVIDRLAVPEGQDRQPSSMSLQMVYANPALHKIHDLFQSLTAPPPPLPSPAESYVSDSCGPPLWMPVLARFQKWALKTPLPIPGAAPLPYIFRDLCWSAIDLSNRYRIISGSPAVAAPTPSTPETPLSPSFLACPEKPGTPAVMLRTSATLDWTRIELHAGIPAHIHLLWSIDWAQTALGPIDHWSSTLRTAANVVMSSAHPALLWWGPELTLLYNEAYGQFLGDSHPEPLGQELDKIADGRYNRFKTFLLAVRSKGEGLLKNEELNRVCRNGRVEDVYVTWSMAAVVGDRGNVEGVISSLYETTSLTLRRRRESVLRNILEETHKAVDMDSFWTALVRGFESAQDEIGFVLVYSLKSSASILQTADSAAGAEPASPKYPPRVRLEGSLGVPDSHMIAARRADLDGTDTGFAPYLRQAMARGGLMMFSTRDNTLSAALVAGLEEPLVDTVAVFPVELDSATVNMRAQMDATDGRTTLGFVVLGLNPFRRLDAAYTTFLQQLNSQLRVSATQFASLEVLVRQGQQEAHKLAQGHSELARRVSYINKVFSEREHKYSRMVEFLPVGLFTAGANGVIIFCNNKWAQMSHHDKNATRITWFDSVCDEDRPGVETLWQKLLGGADALTHEFRLKGTPDSEQTAVSCQAGETARPAPLWVLLNAYPLRRDSATTTLVFGSITDISAQKAAEEYEARQHAEAIEQKQRQDRFIDMLSHEIRNPLSVVIQSADEITSGLAALRGGGAGITRSERAQLVDSFASAAETITLCVNHQTSIVNDVLLLSRMDASLLHVTPVPTRPLEVLRGALRMHEPQLLAGGIRLACEVDPSVEATGLAGPAMLDPTRLRQVIINFMTNAIKFTSHQPRKSVTVRVAAAYDEDTGHQVTADLTLTNCPLLAGASLLPPRPEDFSQYPGGDPSPWGTGRTVNLVISVSDTGPGLSAAVRTQLFQRFWQAPPRTHVTYGGSGLGLYISRNLVEMQGGRVGVTSEEGVGTTFTFYIKTRLCAASEAICDAPLPAAPSSAAPPRSSPVLPRPTHAVTNAAAITRLATAPTNPSSSPAHLDTTPDATMVPPAHIMYVEDNTVNAALAKRQLEKLGARVRIARHGGEALDALRGSCDWAANAGAGPNVGVILMDLEMPVMDGKECTRRIRAYERAGRLTRRHVIIAVTAYTRAAIVDEMAQLDMDGIVAKPFRVRELIAQVNAIIATAGAQDTSSTPIAATAPASSSPATRPVSPTSGVTEEPVRRTRRPVSLTIPVALYPEPIADARRGPAALAFAPMVSVAAERPRPAHITPAPDMATPGEIGDRLSRESSHSESSASEVGPRQSLSTKE